jgi:hypothetical protein
LRIDFGLGQLNHFSGRINCIIVTQSVLFDNLSSIGNMMNRKDNLLHLYMLMAMKAYVHASGAVEHHAIAEGYDKTFSLNLKQSAIIF